MEDMQSFRQGNRKNYSAMDLQAALAGQLELKEQYNYFYMDLCWV